MSPVSPVIDRADEIPPPFPPRPVYPPLPEVHVQPPMVFVQPAWEYRHVTREPGAQGALGEAELNELGAAGWELVGVVTEQTAVHYYFKRQVQ